MLDVNAVELEYISTNISQRAIAEKYGVSSSHIEKLAMEGKWSQKRKDWKRKTEEKVKDEVKNALSTDVAKMAKKHFTVWTKLMNLVDESLNDYQKHLAYNDGTFKIAHLERIANILTKIQEGQKVAKGDDIEIKKLEVMRERLEIERRKIQGPTEDELPDDGFNTAMTSNDDQFWTKVEQNDVVITE
jgi:hypothetical protein